MSNMNVNFCKWKEDCSWNPSTYICENSKYLKIATIEEEWLSMMKL